MIISKEVEKLFPQMKEDRRFLHTHAELSGQEKETTAYVKAVLESLSGIQIVPIGSETGVLALVRGNAAGQTVAIRADIDALPMNEDSGLDFAATVPGVCHSCGHDMHTAALLGLARYLSERLNELPGSVWLIFQPAEETLEGARRMIDLGCLNKDPRPEAIYSIHCDPLYETGRFGLISGCANSSCDIVKLSVRGSGGHGAKSHLCCDTVLTMAQLLVTLRSVVTHDNNYMLPATLTFGKVEGGAAPNVIPKEVTAEGTFRAFYPESRTLIRESILRTAEGTAKAMNCEITAEFSNGIPSTRNDPCLFEELRTILGDAFVQMSLPSSGSEDFSLYQERLPGIQIRLGTAADQDPATRYSLHDPRIHFDENALMYALELYKRIIFRIS